MTAPGGDLPRGTVTFLFTDIEGSTRLLQALGARYTALLGEYIFRDRDDRFSLGWAHHSLGLGASKTGDYAAARAAFDEAMGLFAEARDVSGIALLLLDFSGLALLEGEPERAARLAGGAAALQKSGGVDLAVIVDATQGPWQIGGTLDRQALAAAIEEGRAMPLDALIAYALSRSPQAGAR
ncbi:MAG: hypothetical protein QN183_09980 [Armatimonadota bacterium]|nr:hypothetical protein [Armatimonadota bacterium]MDR7534381.1 hypothetical protein [Armatimonadota bacterium]MDR7536682.1 hypothetical protein [Armatimonadota bacterium]